MPAPKVLDLGVAFGNAKKVRPKTPRQGGGGLRLRWRADDGTIYEWDYQHGNLEVYDRTGKHIGVRRYPLGEQVGGAIDARRVEP